MIYKPQSMKGLLHKIVLLRLLLEVYIPNSILSLKIIFLN